MSAFFTQVWLRQAITPEQVNEITAVFRALGLEVGPIEMKQVESKRVIPDATLLPFIDGMIKKIQSPELHEMAIVWREHFNAAEYTVYSWNITVNLANLIITLPHDEWRQSVPSYDVRINHSLGVFHFIDWFRPAIFHSMVNTIGWLPIANFIISADRHDGWLWGYLAWHILDIAGDGLLHPVARSINVPQDLEELRPLAESGEFPGKIFAIPQTAQAASGPYTHIDHFMDADFLAAWLEHPDFGLS